MFVFEPFPFLACTRSDEFESMLSFISQLPMAEGDTLQGACDGDLEAIAGAEGTKWCDVALDGRTFDQGPQL